MTAPQALSPLPPDRFGLAEAAHLLRRAGLGGSRDAAQQLQAMGIEAAVASFVNPIARDGGGRALDGGAEVARLAALGPDLGLLRRWWLGRLIASDRPLEEQLVLLWHDHFATAAGEVGSPAMMLAQHLRLRRDACGSFRALARGILQDPALLVYLNADGNQGSRPNENLARELMELFTLGVGHYTERDVREAARALTGYVVLEDRPQLEEAAHDFGLKTVLGRTGRIGAEEIIEILLQQDACPRRVAYKLYRHFAEDLTHGVTPEAQPAVDALAQLLRENDYQLAPALRALFRSAAFYEPRLMGSMVKGPAQLIAGTARSLGTPERDAEPLVRFLREAGQDLLDPPGVAGWEGGPAWLSASSLFARHNACVYLLTGRLPGDGAMFADADDYDPMPLLADVDRRSAEAVVDRLLADCLAAPTAPQDRQELVDLARSRPLEAAQVHRLLLLITCLPEYQLC